VIYLRLYILWNDAEIPVVVTDLYKALTYINDLTWVAPDTWFLNTIQGYVIAFYQLNEIRVGVATENVYQ